MSNPSRPEAFEYYHQPSDRRNHLTAVQFNPETDSVPDPETDIVVLHSDQTFENNDITMDSLASPTNPLYHQISQSIKENMKAFTGYQFMGDTVPPKRESLLRGMRNILSNFEEYEVFSDLPTPKLMAAADYPNKTKGFDGKTRSIANITDGCRDEQFEIFTRLAEDNDPLAVALAQIAKLPKLEENSDSPQQPFEPLIAESSQQQLALDSIALFRYEEFQDLVERHIRTLRKNIKNHAK